MSLMLKKKKKPNTVLYYILNLDSRHELLPPPPPQELKPMQSECDGCHNIVYNTCLQGGLTADDSRPWSNPGGWDIQCSCP